MQVLVTGPAKDQRFATTGCHDLHPTWLFPPFESVEVLEGTDVVDFYRPG
jgi:hypothetical protein